MGPRLVKEKTAKFMVAITLINGGLRMSGALPVALGDTFHLLGLKQISGQERFPIVSGQNFLA